MDLKEIKDAVKAWNVKRVHPEEAISYFNQGNCITVTRDDYDYWTTKDPEYIHAYVGIFGTKLKWILIDSVSDKDENLDVDSMFVKAYTYGVPVAGNPNDVLTGVEQDTDEITALEGLETMFRWTMAKNAWCYYQNRQPDGIFQAFQIPFHDFQYLFDDKDKNDVYGLLGLHANRIADFIVWNETSDFDRQHIVADVALPVPPFVPDYMTSYQLLVQSI